MSEEIPGVWVIINSSFLFFFFGLNKVRIVGKGGKQERVVSTSGFYFPCMHSAPYKIILKRSISTESLLQSMVETNQSIF